VSWHASTDGIKNHAIVFACSAMLYMVIDVNQIKV